MSDYPTGLSRFFQPPPPRPTPDLRLNRIADALERIADHLSGAAQPAAPDMSAALEADYQRGRAEERADAVRFLQHHGNQPGSVLLTAARALGYGDHVGAATSDQENYGDGPQ